MGTPSAVGAPNCCWISAADSSVQARAGTVLSYGAEASAAGGAGRVDVVEVGAAVVPGAVAGLSVEPAPLALVAGAAALVAPVDEQAAVTAKRAIPTATTMALLPSFGTGTL